MNLWSAVPLLFANCCVFGQSADSQVVQISSLDTIMIRNQLNLDSVRNTAAARFAAIRISYDSALAVADEQSSRLHAKIDSLEKLDLSVAGLSAQLDSIRQWTNERINALNDKTDKLKSAVNERISNMALPPGLQQKGQELTAVVNELDVSSPEAGMALAWKEKLQSDLTGLDNPLGDMTIPGFNDVDLKGVSPGNLGAEISHYQDQIPDLPTSMEEVSSMAEEQAMGIADANGISEQLSEATSFTETASLPDEQAIKEELVQEAQRQAVDHFQGKEEKLQKALQTLAKYKQKYSKLAGLDQIPKKKPNAMRGKPFIERLLPGIALQIHRKDAWMVDFNLYAGYRFNPRFTAGAGWNQRVAYDVDQYRFDPDLRVYGPRLYGEFSIGEGFSSRVESEYMNTRVPPRFSSGNADANGREWVYSTMAGVKKEYRFLRKVKGTMVLLYNLHDPRHRSPYADKLMVRFGFEFPMKKAPKS